MESIHAESTGSEHVKKVLCTRTIHEHSGTGIEASVGWGGHLHGIRADNEDESDHLQENWYSKCNKDYESQASQCQKRELKWEWQPVLGYWIAFSTQRKQDLCGKKDFLRSRESAT